MVDVNYNNGLNDQIYFCVDIARAENGNCHKLG